MHSLTPTRVYPAAVALAFATASGVGCPGTPTIEALEVLENPDNVLSCLVHWTTDVPASSRIEFGLDGPDQWAVSDDVAATQHELLVYGLRAEATYQLRVLSATAGGAEAEVEGALCETGTPPLEGVVFELSHHEPERIDPGWTAANLVVGSTLSPTVAVILDQDGQPVWYHHMGDGQASGDAEVSLVGDDRVLIGGGVPPETGPRELDLAGRVVWEGPAQPEGLYAEGAWHHSFRPTGHGTYLGLRYGFVDQQLYDRVEEVDRDGETVWSWRSIDHADRIGAEYPHGNNAMLDPDGAAVYYSSRNSSMVWKLDRDDGDVEWALGAEGDFTYVGEHDTPWFLKAHARQLLPDGHVLLYDNGAADDREWSRVVEYAVDDDTMTATIAWEYPGALVDDEWFTFAWGDADRLDDGHTLVCAGTLVGRQSQSRIFEVTPEGDKVWQVLLSVDDGETAAGSYMAQRIPVLLEQLP